VAYFAASIDDAETNRRFAESLQLDYPILSDPEKGIARAFGVLEPEGRYAMRHTFYIGADGTVLFIDTEVNPKTAGADMAARLEELGFPKKE
jgi:peroxiredoxin Q/BCP